MKKVLIISYYWPPAGGISLQRCLKFAIYLRKFNWHPIVYTALDAQYPYFDHENEKLVPGDITVIKRPILEPFNLFRRITGRKKDESLNDIVHVRDRKRSWLDKAGIFIRGNFFIPDARSLWVKPSVKFLTNYLKENPVDAILSDGPPHTNTLIACKLKENTGIPFLADFQDPWTQVDYYQHMMITPLAHRVHSKLEQQVFKQADKITIASPSWKNDLEQIGARNVDVIYWGYDAHDFRGLQPIVNEHFTIFHGGLLGIDRLPDRLFEIMYELQQQGIMIKLKLAGQVDYALQELVEKWGLTNQVQLLGTISRSRVLQYTLGANLLLLPLNKASNAKGRIPGKLFEYLYARRPILCLGPVNSDVSAILKETASGQSFTYNNKKEIQEYIVNLYQLFSENKSSSSLADISQFSVVEQTRKVAVYLDKISKSDARGENKNTLLS